VAVVGFCGALMFVVLGIAFRLHSRSVEDFIVCPEDGPRGASACVERKSLRLWHLSIAWDLLFNPDCMVRVSST
jgi:hypothetical protein